MGEVDGVEEKISEAVKKAFTMRFRKDIYRAAEFR